MFRSNDSFSEFTEISSDPSSDSVFSEELFVSNFFDSFSNEDWVAENESDNNSNDGKGGGVPREIPNVECQDSGSNV
jgi:hypothetical protein